MRKLFAILGGVTIPGTDVPAIFTKKEDAEQAKKGLGPWGSDGDVKPVWFFDSVEEFEKFTKDKSRDQICAKD